MAVYMATDQQIEQIIYNQLNKHIETYIITSWNKF